MSQDSNSKTESAKRALSIVILGKPSTELEKIIRVVAKRYGLTLTISESIQETLELSTFSPRILVFGISVNKEDLVQCVSLCKLLEDRINNASGRLILLYGPEHESLAESLRKFDFHDFLPLQPCPDINLLSRAVLASRVELQVAPEFLSTPQKKEGPESTAAQQEPSKATPTQPAKPEPPVVARVRNTPPTEHLADFWIRSKLRGQEPRKIGPRWKISLKGPSPLVGGWFQTSAPPPCITPPHDQEPGWWEWKFREGMIPPAKNSFNPQEFEPEKYRWVAHGAEPWAEGELWHFSGLFPLLVLLDKTGVEERIAAIRFIARNGATLDFAYDSPNARYITTKIDTTWESLTKDILQVRSIDPSQFQTRQYKKPDAKNLYSQLEVAAPSKKPQLQNDPLPDLNEGPIGPALFFKKYGGFDEFELRWLYTEWLLKAGGEVGKKRSDDITEVTLHDLAYQWFDFATELVQSVSPHAELELWQEIEAGLDLLEEVRFFDADEAPNTKPSKQMAFAGLSSLPGVRGFSKRARWGVSQLERPLGVALVVRQNDQNPLPNEVISTLERVTEFIAQTLPSQLSKRRTASMQKAS
jgi:hypothetical protein